MQRAVRSIRYHAEAYGIDPNRLGALGGSSGGHLVNMLGVLEGAGDPENLDPVNRESARVQCVVARAAPSSLLHMGRDSSLLGLSLKSAAPGTIEHKTFLEASPVTHVSPESSPFLLIHGDADETVPFEQSEIMAEALRKANVDVELLRIPGGGHGATFGGVPGPPDYVGEIVRWFDRMLPEA